MIDKGRHNVLGVGVCAVDYETAVDRILEAASEGKTLGVSALAVHGVMTGAMDSEHAARLNALDLVVPDGQPVRWALNWLYKLDLRDRVYGPDLTLKVVEAMAAAGHGMFLYGSTPEVLAQFEANLRKKYPGLTINGTAPSAFRTVSEEEQREIARTIQASGAKAVLVGLGCPRQEVWVYEHLSLLDMPMLAVGAAFDFHAGLLPQAPPFMQRYGLEWLFRLYQEPKRLWRRYLFLNPAFIYQLIKQKTGCFGTGAGRESRAPRFKGYA
ncbi:WecB/TagA/CpsF family glycosyltransferase [Parahaliea mediterranea]|uniref:WecB/TagA/CpsF family glycosyltransferase n=1 Tax=Parahaliea mediterranea TaxID=651086 RepID=UPI000E2FC66D|nr:WecB/TagA/CpsF family glycosyltransferase [Parahaliea mediterranea]